MNEELEAREGLPKILDAFVSGVCGYCSELLLDPPDPKLTRLIFSEESEADETGRSTVPIEL